jgi:predicted amidohydrolase YtcJ
MSLLVRNAEMGTRQVDLRIDGGRVVAVGVGLAPRRDDEAVIDAAGGAILPGVKDHHAHLLSMAAALSSVVVGPPEVPDFAAFEQRLSAAARAAPPDGWIRAIGYHESVAGDLDRGIIDAVVPDRAVRVQHRSGMLWVCNSRAIDVLSLEGRDAVEIERDGHGRATGRIWRGDHLLRVLLRATGAGETSLDDALGMISRRAASWGITGITDATADRSAEEHDLLVDAVHRKVIVQHLCLMEPPGARVTTGGPVSIGPVKIVLDDHGLPALTDLSDRIVSAHTEGRPVAVHCVSREQLALAVAALEAAGGGRGDRIEHGSIIPPDFDAHLRSLGVTVVTQPSFVVERGDRYREDVDADDVPHLYRCASLLRAGVLVACGTDAPFGDADPWRAMRAATERRTASGRILGADERVSPGLAIRLFQGWPDSPGRPGGVGVGSRADLCLLGVPRAVAERDLSSSNVLCTVIDGEVVYRA